MYTEWFVKYLKSRTDAPPDFHLHAAMATLSYAMGSNVWCDGWGRPVRPNLWLIIIAPSGYGKSVPLDMAEGVIRKAGLDHGILPGSFSQEALLSKLSTSPTSMFILQEFSAFIRGLEREYNSGATAWLTELFDVPEVYERIVMRKDEPKSIILKRPCITILGASSPSWFSETFKEGSLRGGFLARFLFCPSTQTGDYVGHPGPRDDGLESTLAEHLQMVGKLSGKANMDAIRKRFNEWDHEYRMKVRKECPPEFSGMRSRAGLMVLKSAMLLHVSADPTNLEIDEEDLDKAIKYVEWSVKRAEKYLTEEVARDKYEDQRMKILEVVARGDGRLQWSKALMNSHLSARDFREAVETLEQSNRITRETGSGNGYLTLPTFKPHTNGVAH